MSIRLSPKAAGQPDFSLVAWGAFEVLVPELGMPTIHIAGTREAGVAGRVSSPVGKIDARNRGLVTISGRIYRLVGAPGLRGDATYIWQRWVFSWKATVLGDAAPTLVSIFETEEASDGDDTRERWSFEYGTMAADRILREYADRLLRELHHVDDDTPKPATLVTGYR